MKRYLFWLLVIQSCCWGGCFSIVVSLQDANTIAVKIWKNECGGSIEGLTTWNKGEGFASMGIGHFIWYANKGKEPFQETFPELMVFLKKEGAEPPLWLKDVEVCPWKSREDFYQHIQSPEMILLRQFLYETKHLQAIFMAKRLEKALPQMIDGLTVRDKERITVVFYRLADDSRGLYALIDYLNFKGLGISPKETYQGKAWGLLQVLLGVSPTSKDIVKDFAVSAQKVLTQRVQNSPPERGEQRWLKGWNNRVNGYVGDT